MREAEEAFWSGLETGKGAKRAVATEEDSQDASAPAAAAVVDGGDDGEVAAE